MEGNEALPAAEEDALIVNGTSLNRGASAITAIGGLLTALLGAQLLELNFRVAAMNAIPYVWIIVGVTLILLATRLYRARRIATLASAAVAGVSVVLLLAWAIYGFSRGIISCLAFLAPATLMLATLFCAFAIKPAIKAEAARKRLSDEGIELGF